jgi:hypothetical protein
VRRGIVAPVSFQPPPAPQKIPSRKFFVNVFCRDVMSRLEEVNASLTSVFGRILKVDSTKKVVRKLQGTAANTAAWASNVGNEHGQVSFC